MRCDVEPLWLVKQVLGFSFVYMAVEVVANPYSLWAWPLTKRVMKSTHKRQGKAVMDVSLL